MVKVSLNPIIMQKRNPCKIITYGSATQTMFLGISWRSEIKGDTPVIYTSINQISPTISNAVHDNSIRCCITQNVGIYDATIVSLTLNFPLNYFFNKINIKLNIGLKMNKTLII